MKAEDQRVGAGCYFRFSLAAIGLVAASLRAAPRVDPAIPVPEIPVELKPAFSGDSHRFENLFQPLRTQMAALSPDGRLLAYTLREGSTVWVLVVEVDRPSVVKAKVAVVTDDAATPMMTKSKGRTPGLVTWMRWATPNRLVLETNTQIPFRNREVWYSIPGVIVAFDADGSHLKPLVKPGDVTILERRFSIPYPFNSIASAYELAMIPKEFEGDGPPATSGFFNQQVNAVPSGATPAASSGLFDAPIQLPKPAGEPDPNDSQAFMKFEIVRRPSAVDFTADDSEWLVIRADDYPSEFRAGRNERFKVNVLTGAMKSLGIEETQDKDYTVLLDHQGDGGITVPATTAISFPHVFVYDPRKKVAGVPTRSLDAIAGYTRQAGFSLSPENYFGERAVPLGFAWDAQTLYFASNIGRDTFGIYQLDLKSGKRTDVALESPTMDLYEPTAPAAGKFFEGESLVFDRYTHQLAGIRIKAERLGTTRWIQPEFQAVQALLEKTLPGRAVEIQEWDKAGRRFLVYAHGPTDPGVLYVFDRTTGKLAEFVRRLPDFDDVKSNPPIPFSFSPSTGGTVSGIVTVPRAVRLRPAPVVVLCQPEPWQRVPSDYQPGVIALAEMGVFVLQVNPRSAWGSGRKQRELAKDGFEAGQVADIVASLDQLGRRFDVSLKRVAIMGEGRGAYLALRAMQLRPDRFRCAFALEPIVDISHWLKETHWTSGDVGPALTRSFYGSDENLAAAPLRRHPELIKGPILLMSYRGNAGEDETFAHKAAHDFGKSVSDRGVTVRFTELSEDYNQRIPRARAAAFREIEDFLNEYIYNFRVDVGDPQLKSGK